MVPLRPVIDAVLAQLNTDPQLVGDHVAPDGASFPYAVLYSLDLVEVDGDLRDVNVTGWTSFQVTSVGETREQAQALSDRLRALLEGQKLSGTGFVLGPWRIVLAGRVDRDDDVKPPLFYAIDVIEVFTSPA